MAAERLSRGFKDISLSFQYNPLTKDIIAINNETAISRSVRNLVLTSIAETPFNYTKGSAVSKTLFENLDEISATIFQNEIKKLIEEYEPRVLVRRIIVLPNLDMNQYDIEIQYTIIGLPLPVQLISFVLTPTR